MTPKTLAPLILTLLLPMLGAADEVEHPARAGYPQEISRWAIPSDTGRYIGYLVGGGACWHHGEPRYPDEGTWGWDYQGCFPRRVNLLWWHGRRYQGGTGAYKTDGPHLPNPE